MAMKQYIVQRLLYSLITLWLLSVIVFAVVRFTGDPALLMSDYPGVRPEDLAALRAQWGLDKPYLTQYVMFISNVVRGDLGTSFQFNMPVLDVYLKRLPNSLQLGLAGFLISISIGLPLGMMSAVRVNSRWDSVGKLMALLGLSVPGFFVALVLILFFAVYLRWLPVLGKGQDFWDVQYLIMPAFALGWYFAGSMLRLTRSSMLEVLGTEYVKLARFKGTPERVVISKHAFRNAMLPVLTLAGLQLVLMINVAVVVEVIFSWPGIGRLLMEGLLSRDFPVVQGVVLMAGTMIVAVNLLIDILYAYIDPRIRLMR
jgi:ABC-type dipeptide/oligopeptide/nickel transport system permease component